jgi:two-component system, OmpR family, sensor kinase
MSTSTTAEGSLSRHRSERRQSRSLSTGLQLTILIVLLLLGSFFVAGWIAVRISTGEQIRQIDRNLDESVSGARQLFSTLSIEQVSALRDLPSTVSYASIGSSGRPTTDPVFGQLDSETLDLSSLGSSALFTRIGEPFTFTTTDGRPLRVLIVPTDGGGYLAGVTPLSRVRSSQDRLATQLFLVGIGVSSAVGLLTWGAVNTILAPMRTMVTKARQISNGVPGVALDLQHGATEVRELGVALDNMRTALSASSERTRRFAADASHDLRTPLSVIRGHVQLQRAGAATSDPWDDIEHSVNRMDRLVNDLLFLSRSETLDESRSGLIDLGELVDAAVTSHRAIDPDRTYKWRRPTRPILIEGDEDQLRRAVDNVLGNVAAHAPPESTATIAVEADAATATWAITDNGPGLGSDELARATDRFWRADRSRSTTGTGLGLAIANSVAIAHRGQLILSSGTEPSGLCGLTVKMTIPRALDTGHRTHTDR